MRCPNCTSLDTQVKDSRPTEDSSVIRRRRVCLACNFRFTTFERVQLRELTVIKRNGRRVPFDRDKLLRSVQIALRKRPVEPERIEQAVSKIVRELESQGESEVSSETIGEMVMEALRTLDDVAYVRFASVYRNFREAKDFEPCWANCRATSRGVEPARVLPDLVNPIWVAHRPKSPDHAGCTAIVDARLRHVGFQPAARVGLLRRRSDIGVSATAGVRLARVDTKLRFGARYIQRTKIGTGAVGARLAFGAQSGRIDRLLGGFPKPSFQFIAGFIVVGREGDEVTDARVPVHEECAVIVRPAVPVPGKCAIVRERDPIWSAAQRYADAVSARFAELKFRPLLDAADEQA